MVRRSTAIRIGITDDELQGRVRNKELQRLSGGAYAVLEDMPKNAAERARELYRLRCLGQATTGRCDGVVLSHQSAAAVHRLWMLAPERERVHTTNVLRAGGSRLKRRHIHPGPVPPEKRVLIDGVAVTSLARTAVDVACASGDFEAALVIFDSALKRGASIPSLAAEIDSVRRVGIAVARRALAFASGKSDSPGESWCRAQLIVAGLPIPQLQVVYPLPSQVAVVDLDWDRKLVGEFDGLLKYRVPEGATAAEATEVIIREKRRQDEIEALGPKVVRSIWENLEKREVAALYGYWIQRLGIR